MTKPFNPKTTTFTNEMLDYIMPSVSPNAWKILCLAMRKTQGWADTSTESGRKESDIISISQYELGCGMSRHTAIDAINECLEKGYLLRSIVGQSFSYRLNLEYDTETDAKSASVFASAKIAPEEEPASAEIAPVTSAESAQTNSNVFNTKETRVPRTKEEILASTKVSLEKSLLKRQLTNAETYPADVREVLEEMEKLWKIKPPISKTQKAFWIQSSRELIDACGEFGISNILTDIHTGFESYMSSHNGIPPFSVNSPKSLVNSARGQAGKLRIKLTEKPKANIPQASEVWIGGVCYLNGVPV